MTKPTSTESEATVHQLRLTALLGAQEIVIRQTAIGTEPMTRELIDAAERIFAWLRDGTKPTA